jgi:hypothetical protein
VQFWEKQKKKKKVLCGSNNKPNQSQNQIPPSNKKPKTIQCDDRSDEVLV